MKDNKKTNNDNKIEMLEKNWLDLSYQSAIISSAIQYKKSQEAIAHKAENEENSLIYGINSINKKVLENKKKYSNIDEEYNVIMSHYNKNLEELADYHDSLIVHGYSKILEEEKKQMNMYKNIYSLLEEEKEAKKKLDNSDDEIREEICELEDKISDSELKVRRLRPTVKKKIIEKEDRIGKAMEAKEQEIQVKSIRGPRLFANAKRVFMGKINPQKMIEKNVFSKLKNRINEYDQNDKKKVRKANSKYTQENIIDTLKSITDEVNE